MKRKAFTMIEVAFAILVLSIILYAIEATYRSMEMKEDARRIYETDSLAASYLQKGKSRCENEGEGSWSAEDAISGNLRRDVYYGCERVNGNLYRVWSKACYPNSNMCQKTKLFYFYMK